MVEGNRLYGLVAALNRRWEEAAPLLDVLHGIREGDTATGIAENLVEKYIAFRIAVSELTDALKQVDPGVIEFAGHHESLKRLREDLGALDPEEGK